MSARPNRARAEVFCRCTCGVVIYAWGDGLDFDAFQHGENPEHARQFSPDEIARAHAARVLTWCRWNDVVGAWKLSRTWDSLLGRWIDEVHRWENAQGS